MPFVGLKIVILSRFVLFGDVVIFDIWEGTKVVCLLVTGLN